MASSISNNLLRHNPALAAYISAWQFQPQGQSVSSAKSHHEAFLNAMNNYRAWQSRTPASRTQYPLISQTKHASLRDCGGAGAALFLVPSLINGAEIFDITSNDSLTNYLKAQGFHLYLLDWHAPKIQESHRARDYVQTIVELSNAIPAKSFGAIGYCIGGTLLQMAAKDCNKLTAATLIGAPWNFHHADTRLGQWTTNLNAIHQKQFLDQTISAYGLFPSLFLDYFFALLNPLQFIEKFNVPPANMAKFDAVEDWLTNGRDLDIGFARELFGSWFLENSLMQPSALKSFSHDKPTLLIQGIKDHIAPPASCNPIQKSLDNAQEILHPSGHMGLMIGNNAQTHVWPQMAKFFKSHIAQ